MHSMYYDNLRIHQGLTTLLAKDLYLLANNLSERSLTHKLAEHYQNLFFEWNVDCEYNTNLGGPKRIFDGAGKILEEMANKLEESAYLRDVDFAAKLENKHGLKEQMKDLEHQLRNPKIEYVEGLDILLFELRLDEETTVKKVIFPDIIIHHRGTPNNHIVIEAKKTDNTKVKARAYDILKLMMLTSSPAFNYERGYFIDLPTGGRLKTFKGFLDSKEIYPKVFSIEPT